MPEARTLSVGLVALAAAVALPGTGCADKTPHETPEVVRPVKTVVVGTGLSDGFTFPGTVRGSERAELSFQVSGPLGICQSVSSELQP